MNDWQLVKLGNVAKLNYWKALKTEDRIYGDIPVFSSAGLTGYHNQPLVNSKGLIVGRKGTVGKIYYSETPFFCIDTAYYILPDDDSYNLDYLYYLLKTLGLEELNEDSAVPGLNRETAYNQYFYLPQISEQKAIAAVLSSLDDKIDLLHRQNKTLEAMAETLFRQWFIEDAQADWEEGKVEDLFVLQRGYDLPIQNRVDGKYPIFAASGFSGGHAEYKVTAPGVTTGQSGLIGKVFFIQDDFWPLNTSLYITWIRDLKPHKKLYITD